MTDIETSGGSQSKAQRDIVALGIAIAAIILFVGTGGSLMPQIVRSWMGTGAAPDMLLTNAVLLNIALLIFGWRRYDDLQREIAIRRRAEQRARELAEKDPLTGCLNRRSGGPAIDSLIAQAEMTDREVAVMMIDLDNFKQINDVNGHKMGDVVLTNIAHRIRDKLPHDGVVARIGGDEFLCAFLVDPTQRSRIESWADSVVSAISQPIVEDDIRVDATVSVGITISEIASKGAEENSSEKLIHRADIAMYHGKKAGRNRYVWFESQMEKELRFRNELERALRQGIAARDFVPFYEQQIDIQTGRLVGFEMLARWKSDHFGHIGPEMFIPMAEELDLIGELSESLVRQALTDAREWPSDLTLSINISPVQLRDPWFAQKLLGLLKEYEFPPHRLEIEITESCLHEDIGAVRTIVMCLKNQGVRLSLDDFGTGYSSLSQLRSLPFDRLKIDRSFISDLRGNAGNSELVEAIIAMGRGLAMPITAEGVESAEVMESLRGMGPISGQGYHYGRPESAERTRQRIALLGKAEDDAANPGEPPAEKRAAS